MPPAAAALPDVAGMSTAQLASEIASAGAPPVATKDGPKSPTRKMEQKASERKEAVLRATLLATRSQRLRADVLVPALCGCLLRGARGAKEPASRAHARLAAALLREVGSFAAEDEATLEECLREAVSARELGGGVNGGQEGGFHLSGGSAFATELSLRVLARAPPRLAARVLWLERARLERLVAGDGASGAETEARAAAVAAVGATLSRASALDALARVEGDGADATGAFGEGAKCAAAYWKRVLGVVTGADGERTPPPRVLAAAFNAVALLVGPALDACHPSLARCLALHARECEDFGAYDLAAPSVGCSPEDAAGPATAAGGDDPRSERCSLLAALRLDATLTLLVRARDVANRAASLPLSARCVGIGAVCAAACAGLERGGPSDDEEGSTGPGSDERKGTPLGRRREPPQTSALRRLRDAARTSLPDPGANALVDDEEKTHRLGLAAADAVGETLLRRTRADAEAAPMTMGDGLSPRAFGDDAQASDAAGVPRDDAAPLRAAFAAGVALLALSGSLPRASRPLDWASDGTAMLMRAWDALPPANEDERDDPRSGWVSSKKIWWTLVDHAEEEERGAGSKHAAPGDKNAPSGDAASAFAAETLLRLRPLRPAGDATSPLSRAAAALAVAAALPTMPVNLPLPAIRALVDRSRLGLASRPDVRVAALSRAFRCHAEMRAHPEAIVVMTPLGEIIGAHVADDRDQSREAAERADANERAATSAAEEAGVFEAGGRRGSMFGSSKATRLKNEAREDAKTRLAATRAEAAKARTAAEAGDAFREELVTCAAEAILSLRPEDEEAKAGWCQVALEASATLRSAALRRDPSAAGSRTTGNRSRNRSSSRRAASDASLRLIARLCAATKAAASEGSRPEAPGTHKAALRVLAALVQESGSSEYSGGPPDDAALAGVAWVACRYVELPVGDAANAAVGAPGGPLGRAIAAIVRDLCAGGAGRAFAERRNAAAQREAGTLHAPEEDEDGPARGGASSSDAPSSDVCPYSGAAASDIAAAGLACAETLCARCPSMSAATARMLDALIREGDGEAYARRVGRAACERARRTRERLTRRAASAAPAWDPPRPPASDPPPLVLARLLDAAREGGEDWSVRTDAFGVRDATETSDKTSSDASSRDAGGDLDFSLAARARRASAMDAAFACVTRGDRELAAPTDAAPFAALTGASDPTFVEASHVVDPATRVATVTLRCRPQPATNAPAAPGAAAATLAGTLTVATSGPARFADGAPGVVVELGGGSPHNSWDHAGSRFGRGRGGSGGAGRSGEREALSAAFPPGHLVRRRGEGAGAEAEVHLELRALAFGRVEVRPVVTYDDPSGVGGASVRRLSGPASSDARNVASLRCAAYAVPLPDLLVPAPAPAPLFERTWSLLPASCEIAAHLDSNRADVAKALAKGASELDVVVAALGGERATWPEAGEASERESLLGNRAFAFARAKARTEDRNPRHEFASSLASFAGARRAFAPCGGYPLAAAGAACEFFAAATLDGEPVLCVAFASRGSARLEYRARAKATTAAIASDPEGWLRALTNGALRVAAWDREEDGELFEPPRVPRGGGQRTPAEARAAAAKEWRAMATAPRDEGGGGRGGRVGAGAAEAGTVRALGGVGAVFA